MPVLEGRCSRSLVNASRPPAEAPMPTIGNPSLSGCGDWDRARGGAGVGIGFSERGRAFAVRFAGARRGGVFFFRGLATFPQPPSRDADPISSILQSIPRKARGGGGEIHSVGDFRDFLQE